MSRSEVPKLTLWDLVEFYVPAKKPVDPAMVDQFEAMKRQLAVMGRDKLAAFWEAKAVTEKLGAQ